MTFSEILLRLKEGCVVGRTSNQEWIGKAVVLQIPAIISRDIVPRMTSLPDSAKMRIGTVGSGRIHYENQALILTWRDDEVSDVEATSYTPTWNDILAEDWEVL